MSKELKEQTEREIQEFEKQLEQEKQDVEGDNCTHCGAKTTTFPYNEFFIVPGRQMFGWLECPFCGQVFCPLSVRRKKAVLYGLKKKGDVVV